MLPTGCARSSPTSTSATRPRPSSPPPTPLPAPPRRVAVTGLGIISPIGQDIETAWTNLVEGNSGLKRITRFDASIYEAQAAGEVNDFDPNAWMNFKEVRRTDRNVVLGVAAAKMALADSGLEITDDNRDEIGVIFGSGGGGPQLIMDAKEAWDTKGGPTGRPFFLANTLPDTASGQIAIETGIRGPNMCVVTACSTGTHNLGEAAKVTRRCGFFATLRGPPKSPLLEIVHVGFSNMRGMGLPRPGEGIETVSRPFDLTRNGFVLGEGAGGLMLEGPQLAKGRGAKDSAGG